MAWSVLSPREVEAQQSNVAAMKRVDNFTVFPIIGASRSLWSVANTMLFGGCAGPSIGGAANRQTA